MAYQLNCLREHEIQQVFALYAEAFELPHQQDRRARHVLAGMCRLVDARVGMLTWDKPQPEDWTNPLVLSVVEVGLDDHQRQRMLDYFSQEDPDNIGNRPLAEKLHDPACLAGHTLTTRREQLIETPHWRRSRQHNEFLRAIDLDESAMSCSVVEKYRGQQGLSRDLILMRTRRASAFTDRETALIHLFWSQSHRLFPDPPASAHPPSHAQETARQIAQVIGRLPRRLNQVLVLLLDGHDTPAMARRLKLSVHTVREHTARLYGRLGIRRRSEFAGRCMQLLEIARQAETARAENEQQLLEAAT